MIEELLYRHSGKSNGIGFVIVLGLGTILSMTLGFAYNFLIVVIPFVYVNFFITLGFGLTLGYATKFFSRFGKIRNDVHNRILAVSVGFIGFVFQWIAYFVFLNSGEHSFQAFQSNFDLFYNPILLLELLIELNRTGSWEMFGITFTDFPLWIIWGIEAGVIIGIPFLIAYRHPIIPFSESLNKWYPKYILKNQFERISTQNQFKQDLSKNIVDTIQNLSYGDPFRYSEISIYFLLDEETQYLSVDNIYIEEGGKGKHIRTPVIHLLPMDNKAAKTLKEAYQSKKQFALDY